jgi:hypothetical protein
MIDICTQNKHSQLKNHSDEWFNKCFPFLLIYREINYAKIPLRWFNINDVANTLYFSLSFGAW